MADPDGSSGTGSLTRATVSPQRGVLGRHVAGHALHVCTAVREHYLIGPEHTDSAQQSQRYVAHPTHTNAENTNEKESP
jgi:hypothetical protein